MATVPRGLGVASLVVGCLLLLALTRLYETSNTPGRDNALYIVEPIRETLGQRAHNNSSQPRIALVLYSDPGSYLQRFKHGIADQQCYAIRHGYSFILETGLSDGHVMFRKLRTARKYFDYFDVIVGTDADTFVGFHTKTIEEYLDEDHDIYVQARFHNAEIMGAFYIIRTTEYAKRWVDEWLSYEKRQEAVNGDNGPLHIHIARSLFAPGHEGLKVCEKKWTGLLDGSNQDYLAYVHCVRKLLAAPVKREDCETTKKGRIKVFSTLNGFARVFEKIPTADEPCHAGGNFWCSLLGNELFVHSKFPEDYVDLDRTFTSCDKDFVVNPKNLRFKTREEATRAIERARVHVSVVPYAQEVAKNVSECHPDCPPAWDSKRYQDVCRTLR